ncbi:MAG TPA: SDR family NAD(P)-dependent oxidoreductase [Acidimicrobiales bacterium]
MEQLSGRVAVVTGAGSGIGRALVRRFVDDGMSVVAADVEAGALDETVAGTDAVAVVCDVSDADAVEALAATTYERFGAAHLVCANAGVFQGGISWERSVEDWQWVLGVNLWGVIHATKAFVPRMIEGGDEGHVVVTSSMAGLACAAFSGPYQTSKFGAYAVAESLAHDLRAAGIPIGVSALCPGAVNTRIAGSDRNRPGALAAKGGDDVDFVEGALAGLTSQQGIDPSEVAARVVAGVQAGDFLIPTNDAYADQLRVHTDAQIARQLPPMADFS